MDDINAEIEQHLKSKEDTGKIVVQQPLHPLELAILYSNRSKNKQTKTTLFETYNNNISQFGYEEKMSKKVKTDENPNFDKRDEKFRACTRIHFEGIFKEGQENEHCWLALLGADSLRTKENLLWKCKWCDAFIGYAKTKSKNTETEFPETSAQKTTKKNGFKRRLAEANELQGYVFKTCSNENTYYSASIEKEQEGQKSFCASKLEDLTEKDKKNFLRKFFPSVALEIKETEGEIDLVRAVQNAHNSVNNNL
ncbi:hypothetical protein MHBO_000006 [Bonamia ostreae]|uniref:Uncharacterized protein n=1 Tax=Bonamia ostreae TaxID=126728 RepID=A0ABV2ADY3_9EUKA